VFGWTIDEERSFAVLDAYAQAGGNFIDTADTYGRHVSGGAGEETLETFQALIDEGQVRYVGASNYSARRLLDALRLGEREGLARYVALQPHYNLMERDYELDLAGVCERYGLACVPYFGLARGFLTGKYRPEGEQVDSRRASGRLSAASM
jgi:aryl-alcohol dehydrogenase-like predicted oxidoreductase